MRSGHVCAGPAGSALGGAGSVAAALGANAAAWARPAQRRLQASPTFTHAKHGWPMPPRAEESRFADPMHRRPALAQRAAAVGDVALVGAQADAIRPVVESAGLSIRCGR
jgi:hypothetical protein